MPFFMLYGVSNFLAFMLNHVIGYRKKVIMENLRNSFPEKTEKEINKIRIEFNKSFADQMAETLKLFTISKKELDKRFVYENPEELSKYIKEGRSVVIAGGHYGNWEYPSGFPFKLPGFNQYNIIYAELTNKFFDQKIIDTRERFGCHMISMKNTFREILALPDTGQFYGFIFDQSPHKGLVRYDLEFLNQVTPVHLGTEQVAVKKDAVVVYIDIARTKRGYYSAKLEVITDKPKETQKYKITNLLFQRLEKAIKKEPSLWLWSHKRWKYKRGIDYNIR